MEAKSNPFVGLDKKMAELGMRPLPVLEKRVVPKGITPLDTDIFESIEDVAEREGFVAREKEKISGTFSFLADVLANPKLASVNAEKIAAYEAGIRDSLLGLTEDHWKSERQELIIFTMEMMIDSYPTSALQRIADMGVALGFFVPAGERVSETQKIALPVSNEWNIRWQMTELTCYFPGSKGVLPRLKSHVAAFDAARKQYRDELKRDLRDGITQTFFEALEKGGEAVVIVPHQEGTKDGKPVTYPGGHLRVRVENGFVTPVDAVGGIANHVKRLAEAGNVAIPVSQVDMDELNLKHKLERELYREHWYFHQLLNRARKNLVTREQSKAENREAHDILREKASVDYREFLEDPKIVGMTFLKRRFWRETRGSEVVEYRNVGMLIERNHEGKIRVVETTKEHEELLANSREFAFEDEQKYPLRQMMAMIRGKLVRGDNR